MGAISALFGYSARKSTGSVDSTIVRHAGRDTRSFSDLNNPTRREMMEVTGEKAAETAGRTAVARGVREAGKAGVGTAIINRWTLGLFLGFQEIVNFVWDTLVVAPSERLWALFVWATRPR